MTKHGKATLKGERGRAGVRRVAWAVLRSVLVATRPDGRALGCGADAVVVDPDGLAPWVVDGLARPRVVVRLDPLPEDLGAVLAARPDAVLLPDCRGRADLDRLDARLAVAEACYGLEDGATAVLASVAASAAGLAGLAAGRPLAMPRLVALTWDPARLAADLGLARASWTEGPCALAAALVPVAARAAGVPALAPDGLAGDGPVPDGCRLLRGRGYAGRVTRVAEEVAAINAAFGSP